MDSHVHIDVCYPLKPGQSLLLRTELDWDVSLSPTGEIPGGYRFTVSVPPSVHHLYFKPGLVSGGRFIWSSGSNYLVVFPQEEPHPVWPHFGRPSGALTERFTITTPGGGLSHDVRIYLPPGYAENTLKRYPTLYMHDGQNVFLSEEAYLGGEWRADEMMHRLDEMAVIDKVIVVGVYPRDRMREYSQRGYDSYGRYLVETLKPEIDSRYRTLPGPDNTAVMGSSLGGVVSMHIAWQWPDVVGSAACLSSTFWFDNDLFDRVRSGPLPPIRLYLDSGWPSDNFSVTLEMANLLRRQGMTMGKELMYFAFPMAQHSELHWAARLHLPFQFLFGKVWR